MLCGARQVAQLEERLAELDEEREELAKYRQVDKERRSLEYTIYDKDLHETRLNLEKVCSVNVSGTNLGQLLRCLHQLGKAVLLSNHIGWVHRLGQLYSNVLKTKAHPHN